MSAPDGFGCRVCGEEECVRSDALCVGCGALMHSDGPGLQVCADCHDEQDVGRRIAEDDSDYRDPDEGDR